MAPRKKCIFCGNDAAKISGEHIWSAWIGELFDSASYQMKFVNPESGEVTERDLKGLDLTVNDVCITCNNGWMSQLEARMKAAFSGIITKKIEASLSLLDCTILATFAFKSAVIANCVNRKRDPFFTPAARLRFKNSLEIPSNVQMWLACFSDASSISGLCNGHVLGINNADSPMNGLELYSFTFVAGRLVFQVLALRWDKIIQSGLRLPLLRPGPVWDSYSTLFWPNFGLPIRWPPPKQFGNDSIQKFVHRWRDPITPL